jgi:two-component system phosphate regulon sensor histidine kinase PhoR
MPLLQLPSFSVPVGVIFLALLGLLLLVMALGGWLALRLRPLPPKQPAPPLENILNVLPLPAVLVKPNGQLLAANAEASSWLEAHSPLRLVSPLITLARRVAAGREAETIQVGLGEGRPIVRVQACPLTGAEHSFSGVLLVGLPNDSEAGFNLTRLVAHELRTPLTAIVGHAEILESCNPADEALWRRSRDFIAGETKRLTRLVEDMLALSRLEASPPLLRPVNMRSIAENALAALFDRAEAASLTLTLDAPVGLPRTQADPDRIQQALVNLLDNAVKYTPSGGTVTLQLASEGGYIRVAVSDTGPGIPPDDLPHLFEPLYRADSARHRPGTGLGLTIVRAIIAQHGASISVHSLPEQGTTFMFRLPVAINSG